MIHSPLIHALLPYLVLTGGIAASLGLFLSIKREVRAAGAKSRKRFEEIAQRLNEAHQRTTDPEPLYAPSYTPMPPRSGLNVSKRVQAMRMVRRNEDISHIAAALGVTRKEVELLIRVQGIARAAAKSMGSNA